MLDVSSRFQIILVVFDPTPTGANRANNLFGAFTGTGAPFAYAIVLVFAYGLPGGLKEANGFEIGLWTLKPYGLQ